MLFSTNEENNKNEELYGKKMKEKYLKKQKKKKEKNVRNTIHTNIYMVYVSRATHATCQLHG